MEPAELRALIKEIRECRSALGSPLKHRTSEEENTAAALRRSLVASIDLTAGVVLREEYVSIMRPGTGLSPDNLRKLVGKRLARDVKAGTAITLEDF